MQSASVVQGVSFRKNLRKGQRRVFESISSELSSLNIQLPTGYGKTFTGLGVYSILKHKSRVNRLLIVFPTDAQLKQFEKDVAIDLVDCSVEGPKEAIDLRYKAIPAIRRHRKDECQIFITTIQSLIYKDGFGTVKDLLESGRWMLTVDEYHHYASEKPWMKRIDSLPVQFRLAMSATPDRPNEDSGFGIPAIRIKYRDAVKELAVKPLVGHTYYYRIDAVDDKGELFSFTIDQLKDELGGDTPDKIEQCRISRKMRWSPKYISPLVRIPLERMVVEKTKHCYPLQAIIGAMCVSHAEMVCNQVKALFPELRIDWVGTGTYGRSPAENETIIGKFCPPKDENGIRKKPELDVLVHVGIAGEGLDSINVSEIIHLNKASNNISNAQENGRCARYLPGVIGHINSDGASEYAQFTGAKIMQTMEGNWTASPDQDNDEWEYTESDSETCLPDEPNIRIENLEFLYVDSGDPGVQLFAKVLQSHGMPLAWDEMRCDSDHPDWKILIADYKKMRSIETKEFNEKARIGILRDAVEGAVSAVASDVIRFMSRNGIRIERSFAGDIRTRINTKKKMELGPVDANGEDGYMAHWQWLLRLQRAMRADKEIPSWLK